MLNHGGVVSRRRLIRTAAALGVLGAGGTGVVAGDDTVEVNVGYSRPSGRRAARDEAKSVKREFNFDALTIRVSREGADRLSRRGDVRYVEEDGTMHAHAETLPWGVDRVDADVLHDEGETGSGADVAIIDTGIDDDHPDLRANVGAGKAFARCRGPNCNYEWSDDHDHGTHCAGIADAVDNSEGVVGVATDATLHAVKVLDKNGSGSWSDVAAGIEYVADQGWDVGSLSLGGDSSSRTVKDACQYASDNGVLLVSSAGNDGPCTDCVGYPAAYETVVAVSSIDDLDELSEFSSTGPEIELTAPGSDVYSTVVGEYDTFSGTSMACPHVSGVGGHLMASGYTNAEARDRLTSTAEDLGLPSNEQGAGLLDAEAAVLDGSGGGDTNGAPTVEGLSASEVETDDGDAAFDVDWQVSDADDNLDSVDLSLTDDTDGGTEDTATIGVSGGSASGTTRLVAAADDGSGNSYTVDAVVTDTDGASDSATTSVSETEDTSGGDAAPTIDSFSVSTRTTGPWFRAESDWTVSDGDGDLDTVTTALLDSGGTVLDRVRSDASGSSESGTHEVRSRSNDAASVRLTVTDEAGNSTSDTRDV